MQSRPRAPSEFKVAFPVRLDTARSARHKLNAVKVLALIELGLEPVSSRAGFN